MPDILFNRSDDDEGVSCVEGRDVAHRFPRHAHDSLCAGLVTAGRLTITRGGTATVVNRGRAYFINPNEAHECDIDGASSYVVICVKRARLVSFLGEAEISGDVTLTRAAVDDAGLSSLIVNFAELIRNPHARIEREAAVEALLGHIVSRYGEVRCATAISDAALRGAEKAKAYIDEHLNEDISLGDLSHLAGVSPFFLTRSFSQTYGVPPHRYLTQSRIKRAQRELAGGTRIVDVALDCGFFDQSHFSRIFLRETGMTPGEFLILNGGGRAFTGD